MNFEGSKLVLEGQKIDKREKKDNAGKNNEEAIDLKRRGFLKLISGAAVTAVVGTTAFKIAENVLDLDEEKVIEKMMEISSHPSLIGIFNFGKHLGKKVEEVLKNDRGYLEWLLAQKLESDQIEDDWIYTLQHHLKK